MSLLTQLVNLFFSAAARRNRFFHAASRRVQQQQLERLLTQAGGTVFGRDHGFGKIRTSEAYAAAVPVADYDSFSEYIGRTRTGEQNVLWPTEIKWFAKSSGTSSAKSKFIPVSDEGLSGCHLRGPMDVICFFAGLYPKSGVFGGRTLTLGGSHRLESTGGRAQEGDLSAILIENTPKWAFVAPYAAPRNGADSRFRREGAGDLPRGGAARGSRRLPAYPVVEPRADEPSARISPAKQNILEVWPEMELFVHGGMNFNPYREQYRRIFPSDTMKYMETYNASEGFFAIQDDPSRDDMLLMLDYGVYYEFLPVSDLGDPSKAVPLEGVKQGVNYAMIISTSNGLWRYQIGDTVEFTSLAPYKIKITGRTKHFINAFGEELIIDNAETALQAACAATGALVSDYTAGPIYMGDRSKGSHQWLIEFNRAPEDMDQFTDCLDRELQHVNSDYEAKRFRDTTLMRPTVTVLSEGAFYRWMKSRGKTGGQNKVPRLCNDRTYIEQLLAIEK